MRSAVFSLGVSILLAVPVGVVAAAPAVHAADGADTPSSVVEDYAYPGAEHIFRQYGVRVIKGDGRIRFAPDCAAGGDLIKVESLVGSNALTYCFTTSGPQGFVTLDVPNVFLVRAGSQPMTATASYQGTTEKVSVAPESYEPIGGGNATHTLVELRLTGEAAEQPGTPGAYPFTAKIDTDGRSCSAALVAPQWLVTTKTCFADEGAIQAGPPPKPATALVGRANLAHSGGHKVAVTELQPRADRNLILARLATAVYDIAPVTVAGTAPAAGETLQAVGYGRTATQWVADRVRDAAFRVTDVTATTVELARATGTETSTCKGDVGGPALRVGADGARLIAIHDTSWQTGCVGVSETRDAAIEVRVDDLADWIDAETHRLGSFDGDGRPDLAGIANGALWVHRNTSVPGDVAMAIAGEAVSKGWGSVSKFSAVDFDGDGRTDIVGFNGGDELMVWRSTTTGSGFSFAPYRSFGTGWAVFGKLLPIADYDGDGRPDVAGIAGGDLWIHHNTSTPGHVEITHTGAPVSSGWASVSKFSAVDFDGDGKADIVGFNGGDELMVWRSTSTSAGFGFAPYRSFGQGWAVFDKLLPMADYDGNGRPDVAGIAGGDLWIHHNTSTPGHMEITHTGAPVSSGWASVSKFSAPDFDGDGKADIVGFNGGDELMVWRNTTTGSGFSFAPYRSFGKGWASYGVILGPFPSN